MVNLRRALLVFVLAALLITSVQAGILDNVWDTDCRNAIGADPAGLDVDEVCTDFVAYLNEMAQKEPGINVIVWPQTKGCLKLVRDARTAIANGTVESDADLDDPIAICRNLITQELECRDERKAAGKDPLTCLLLTTHASKILTKHPEHLSETTKIDDVVNLQLLEDCMTNSRKNFADTYADIGEEGLEEECTEYVDFIAGAIDDYGVGALPQIQIRIVACLAFVKQNTNVTNPIIFCKDLLIEEKACVDEKVAAGVAQPLKECDLAHLLVPAIRAKCINDVKKHLPTIADQLGDTALGEECVEYLGFLERIKTDHGQAGVNFVHWQMGECLKGMARGIEENGLDIQNPIKVCERLIWKEKQCVDEFTKAGKKDKGLCFFLASLAGKTVIKHPEILEEDTSLAEVLEVGLVHTCVKDVRLKLPRTYADLGPDGTVTHCVDYVAFLTDTVKTYGIGSLLLVKQRMDACFRFMVTKTDVDNPVLACKTAIMQERECVDKLVAEAHPDPLGACDKRLAAVGVAIALNPKLANLIPQGIPEVRQRAIDRFMERHSSVADLLEKLPEDKREVFLRLDRARQKKLLEKGIEDATELLAKFRVRKVVRKELFRKRLVTAAIQERAKKAYLAARSRFLNARARLATAKADFERYKRLEKECAGKDTPECVEAREKAIEHARTFLTALADNGIHQLEKTRSKVEAADDLAEEDVTDILDAIDTEVAALETAKAAVADATTKDELKTAGLEIVTIGKRVHKKGAIFLQSIAVAHVQDVLARADDLERRLDTVLADLEATGTDVSSLDLKVETFSLHVSTARDKFALAQRHIEEARRLRKDEGQLDAALESANNGKKLVNEAKAELRSAETLLREIARGVKAAGGTLDLDVEEDAEQIVVEEIEMEEVA